MVESPRPDPDRLLAQVQDGEAQSRRGRLKVFLGYAAGVGKTYAMLEAAHQRLAEGVDVVAGYVETHGRAETETLLSGIETLLPRALEYRGIILNEMDVDGLLRRRPQLALVDELAHTNAPDSRHNKRYMDVEELLAAGISVYTTLNIQHLESLNDVVAQITGVVVRERIPDSVLDGADEIELVDLPPAELRQRLQDGKVYVPQSAAHAVQRFFRPGNLNALRELALRETAERVDERLLDYMAQRSIPGPWPAGERLLVCISPSSLSERLVHTARRLADELKADWLAVYVETPAHVHLSEADRQRVPRTLQLAEELAGKAISLPGHSVAETVLEYARRHNVTKIIAGRPERPRWRDLLRGSVLEQIVRLSGNIDVYVVTGGAETSKPAAAEAAGRAPRRWVRYLLSAGIVAGITVLGIPLRAFVSPPNLVMLFLLGVVVAALYLGRGPSALAALLSVVGFDFFFVPPFLSFAVSDTQYLLTFVGLLVVGFVISNLTARAREQADAAQRRELQSLAQYELSRDLAAAEDLSSIVQASLTHIQQVFERQAAVLLPEGAGLVVRAASPGYEIDGKELAVADWVYKHGRPAGRGTNTLPAAAGRYLPLKAARGVVGVLGVRPLDPTLVLTPEQRRLLDAFASQATLAIERTRLAEHNRQLQVLETTERLQSALLNSISHELRTPLVAITGTLSMLEEDGERLDGATRRNLASNGRQQADRLNRLVGNLLDLSRIEAGAVRPRPEPVEPQELIVAALDQLTGRLEGHKVSVDAPADLPLMSAELALAAQALVNVIDNAAKYSAPGSGIAIAARVAGSTIEISVADRGDGIPPQDVERVFDKFYRVQRVDGVGGIGLGLAISKGLVEAQGGRIWAANRPGGGSIVTLSLPLATGDAPQRD